MEAFALRARVGHRQLKPPMRAVQIPRAAIVEVSVKRVREVLLHEQHVADVSVREVRQRHINEAVRAAKREGRLRALFGEDAKAGTFAAGHDNGKDVGKSHFSSLNAHPADSRVIQPRRLLVAKLLVQYLAGGATGSLRVDWRLIWPAAA